jgi:hypothetical protein
MKKSTLYSLLTLPAFLALPLSGTTLLHDNFTVGDGTGGTYVTGNVNGQSGGQGWATDSQWVVNGAQVNIDVHAGNYLNFYKSGNGSTNTRSARREFGDYGLPLSSLQIQFTVEMANLTGMASLLDTNASHTTGTGSNTASEYWVFQNRDSAGALDHDQNPSGWWLEAAAGHWYALGGGGGSTIYGTPVQLAPIVEGESYTITMSFSGNNEWAVNIVMSDTEQSYDSGWMPFINNIADDQINSLIHFRNRYNSIISGGTENPFEINVHDITIVPEPATYAALLGGLALIGVVVIRRRR